MNILIETGATKSRSIGYSDGSIFFNYKNAGINATYSTNEFIGEVLQDIITTNNVEVDEVQKVRYYGAGCMNLQNIEKVKKILQKFFPYAKIDVFSDLLAVCHALCKYDKGFVGILGTGAASCLYDGKEIIDKAPSLGYLLGDEGSGTYLGKRFLIKYLNDKFEDDITQDFEKTFEVNKQKVFQKIYQEPNPQTFLSSIPVFMYKHKENPKIEQLVSNAFYTFFQQQKKYYKRFWFPWYFCGSIAYYFQDILKEVAGKLNIEIAAIEQECAQRLLN